MDEELANELLDDIDYHFNKVKCRKIEGMMPRLMGMVESEIIGGHREKENAPWHLNMSRSNLKAQNEQAQVKPYSANAEDQFGSTLNEPTY